MKTIVEFSLRLIQLATRLIYLFMLIIPTLIGIGFIILLTWLLGNIMTAFFGINIVLSYIINFILATLTFTSILLNKNPGGNYSPAAFFFLGWLIGHK